MPDRRFHASTLPRRRRCRESLTLTLTLTPVATHSAWAYIFPIFPIFPTGVPPDAKSAAPTWPWGRVSGAGQYWLYHPVHMRREPGRPWVLEWLFWKGMGRDGSDSARFAYWRLPGTSLDTLLTSPPVCLCRIQRFATGAAPPRGSLVDWYIAWLAVCACACNLNPYRETNGNESTVDWRSLDESGRLVLA